MRRNKASAVLSAWAALAVATLLAQRATKHGAPAPAPEVRPARTAFINRHLVDAPAYAVVASLWGDRQGVQCRVPAIWGERPAQAAFAPLMRVSVRSPAAVASLAQAAGGWVSRERIELTAANDADIAQRLVTVEPGSSPVVRILRGHRFRPRRATFGGQEAMAA